jgi:deoxyribodipyrimidine photolyase-like uncharacterized protein
MVLNLLGMIWSIPENIKPIDDLEPFYFGVTRMQALVALNLFVTQRLPNFGDYQDVMIEGEPCMYH